MIPYPSFLGAEVHFPTMKLPRLSFSGSSGTVKDLTSGLSTNRKSGTWILDVLEGEGMVNMRAASRSHKYKIYYYISYTLDIN